MTYETKSIQIPKRIAMYVIYDKDGILDGYRKYYLEELRKVTDKIVAVVSGTITPESRDELEQLADDILVRENKGLLAGSWIDGIQHIGWDELYEYDELLMLNDSFFGPFYPLENMFNEMEKSDADFYGAFRNFENKDFKSMQGRSFKHGYLKGSICYFYIIKRRLLHSNEFKKYWSSKPEISSDLDTFFFSEFDFYDYVVDAGFKVDAYQSDELEKYCFDNLSHNMNKLIKNDEIPFARIRPFGSDMQRQSMQLHYGKDPRETLQYIDKETAYDANLIWDYLLRTKNMTDLWYQHQLEYIVSYNNLDKSYNYNKRIAVVLHIYYQDQVEKMASYCANFPELTDFYVTTTDKETEKTIDEAFTKRKLNYKCTVRPNVGVAMSTLWITYSDITLKGDYEYICYFHDKKSPYWSYDITGEQFGARCYENLVGSNEIIKNIINLFEENPRLGMIGPPRVYHGPFFNVAMTTWGKNYQNVVDLAKKLELKVDIRENTVPVAPYGDMFWYRADALKKAIGYGFTYDDFDFKYSPDGTILHAIERTYAFMVQDAGYYYAEVINSDNARADLVSYQYMLEQICSAVMWNGHLPYDYNELLKIINHYNGQPISTRIAIKNKIKAKCPRFIWTIAKKIYHIFGGKKWIG